MAKQSSSHGQPNPSVSASWIAAPNHSSDEENCHEVLLLESSSDGDSTNDSGDEIHLHVDNSVEPESVRITEDHNEEKIPKMKRWWRKLVTKYPGRSVLHEEILKFCQWLQLTEEEKLDRARAVEQIESASMSLWKDSRVHVFGSSVTGLALPGSDIDLVIESNTDNVSLTPQQWQRKLAKTLHRRQVVLKTEFVLHAKVPILKLIMSSGSLNVDICLNNMNGPQALPLVQLLLGKYPTLRPLCLLLKCFLCQNNFHKTYEGGLGSYCLLNLVAAHLSDLEREEGTDDLGKLLLGFFFRYGEIHDYANDVVSINGRKESKQSRGWVSAPNPELLAVEDPQAPQNDIGRVTFRIGEIQKQFSRMAAQLADHLDSGGTLQMLLHLQRRRDNISDPSQQAILSSKSKSKTNKRGRSPSRDPNPNPNPPTPPPPLRKSGQFHSGNFKRGKPDRESQLPAWLSPTNMHHHPRRLPQRVLLDPHRSPGLTPLFNGGRSSVSQFDRLAAAGLNPAPAAPFHGFPLWAPSPQQAPPQRRHLEPRSYPRRGGGGHIGQFHGARHPILPGAVPHLSTVQGRFQGRTVVQVGREVADYARDYGRR